jgi:hypothetical protein
MHSYTSKISKGFFKIHIFPIKNICLLIYWYGEMKRRIPLREDVFQKRRKEAKKKKKKERKRKDVSRY